MPDDKSDRLTTDDLDYALHLAKTEPRASVSCSLTVLYRVFLSMDWVEDNALRVMLAKILHINECAGIREGMTDYESEIYSRMLERVSKPSAKRRKGGA
jgi:hypothetical protein